MAKLNKEQTAKFNKLYETSVNWGEGNGPCTGLFAELAPESANLNYFATEVVDGYLEILESDGPYYDSHGAIEIDSKTKGKLKKIVEHLIDRDFNTLIVK